MVELGKKPQNPNNHFIDLVGVLTSNSLAFAIGLVCVSVFLLFYVKKAIQLAYGTSMVLIRCPFVSEIMQKGAADFNMMTPVQTNINRHFRADKAHGMMYTFNESREQQNL
jgi:hypothetical protein